MATPEGTCLDHAGVAVVSHPIGRDVITTASQGDDLARLADEAAGGYVVHLTRDGKRVAGSPLTSPSDATHLPRGASDRHAHLLYPATRPVVEPITAGSSCGYGIAAWQRADDRTSRSVNGTHRPDQRRVNAAGSARNWVR
jgi:hypothetical protein